MFKKLAHLINLLFDKEYWINLDIMEEQAVYDKEMQDKADRATDEYESMKSD